MALASIKHVKTSISISDLERAPNAGDKYASTKALANFCPLIGFEIAALMSTALLPANNPVLYFGIRNRTLEDSTAEQGRAELPFLFTREHES